MKRRFALLTILLLFARGCDFYSTSLWFFQENGMAGETNPLTKFFGIGWNGLIITNIFLVGLIIAMYYYYCFRYKPKEEFKTKPRNYKEYASWLYFDRPDRFFQILYKIPKNPQVLVGHAGYVLVRVLIFGSALATIHNLCQYYSFAFYDTYREIVKRPLYVIYGIIAFSVIAFYLRLLIREFSAYNDKLLTKKAKQ